MAKRENPSSVRSKKLIVKALLKLMTEKPFHKITVQDISKESELARMTFYGNFDTKEDVLKYHSDNLLIEFIEEIQQKKDQLVQVDEFTQMYFTFWKKHGDFIEVLYKNDLSIMVKLYEKYFFELNDIFQFIPNFEETDVENMYYSSFISGGSWNMVANWVGSGMKESPEEMAKIFMSWRNRINFIE